MSFLLASGPLDPDALSREVLSPARGGLVTFVGTTREESAGRRVVRLEYEAFEPMARTEMERILGEARERFPGAEVRVAHRTGLVPIGEAAVVVAVAAPHRAEAFEACRFLIDRLKERVPIWKKEVFEDGAVWVGERP